VTKKKNHSKLKDLFKPWYTKAGLFLAWVLAFPLFTTWTGRYSQIILRPYVFFFRKGIFESPLSYFLPGLMAIVFVSLISVSLFIYFYKNLYPLLNKKQLKNGRLCGVVCFLIILLVVYGLNILLSFFLFNSRVVID